MKMNVEKYNIFRMTTHRVLNNLNEEIFPKGTIVQCIYDLQSLWLAVPVGSKGTPRMLPNSDCRQLTDKEKITLSERTKGA